LTGWTCCRIEPVSGYDGVNNLGGKLWRKSDQQRRKQEFQRSRRFEK